MGPHMLLKTILVTATVLLTAHSALACETVKGMDFPAKEVGLKNHGTLATLRAGVQLFSLSDDISKMAFTQDYNRDGDTELVFHIRRVPRNPFFIIYERVVLDHAEDAFEDDLKSQISAYEAREVTLKDGTTTTVNIVGNPTDPCMSHLYENEDTADDMLQFATQQLGAQELARYDVLQLIRKVDQDSLHLMSRNEGRLHFGMTMKDGSSHTFEIDDLGYTKIEAEPDIEIATLPQRAP